MQDLISIVVPIYNVEKYLEKCLKSIVNQTYKNLEIILVNDGSKDNGLKICQSFSKDDSRIIIIDKENGGLSSARNAGINIATGKYIMFIDSDDYIELNMVEELYVNITNNDADMSICNYYTTTNDEDKMNSSTLNKTITDDSKYNYLYGKYAIQTIISWNKLYKKELFEEIRYPDGIIHEDQYIICDLLEKSTKINYMTDRFLYHYVQRENSIMKTFNIKRFDVIKGLDRRIDFFQKNNNKPLEDRTKLEKVQLLFQLLSESEKFKLEKDKGEQINNYRQELKVTINELKNSKLSFISKVKLYLIAKVPGLYSYLKKK